MPLLSNSENNMKIKTRVFSGHEFMKRICAEGFKVRFKKNGASDVIFSHTKF